MVAQTQPVSAQSDKPQLDAAMEEQARLRASLTPDELAADHARKVRAFLESCEAMSAEAQRNGLTEEILASILAEK